MAQKMGAFSAICCIGLHFVLLVNFQSAASQESACYDNVGCFTIGEGPLGHVPVLPEDPNKLEHQFEFWTRDHSDEPVLIPAVSISTDLLSSLGLDVFDPTLPVKFVCHGFTDNGYEDWMLGIKDVFLEREPTNVVMIDWERGALGLNYVQAARNAELVGRQLGNVIKAMLDLGLDQSQFYMVGHSLGAQIMNMVVGWVRQERPDFSPARITGLDPANPFFCDSPDYGIETYLEETDAQFVDIMHSNMGKLVFGHVGCERNLGHVDYYPNGGASQPGCPNPIFGTIEDIFSGENSKACSHRRSVYLYVESARDPSKFKAYPCPGLTDFEADFLGGDCFSCEATETGCGHMGYFSQDSTARGPMYLKTFSQEEPDGILEFAGHMIRVAVTSSPLQDDVTVGQFVITIHDPDNGDLGPFDITREDEKIQEGSVWSNVLLTRKETQDKWDFMGATFEYKGYDGILVDGKPFWFIDRIEVDFENGRRFYYCRTMGQFDSNTPKEITLSTAQC